MMFLKQMQLKEKYRGMKPFTLDFLSGLNVIVGENGSGKSSLLSLITDPNSSLREIAVNETEFAFHFFDTEKMNPRIRKDFMASGVVALLVNSKYQSHGEAMLPMLNHAEEMHNSLILVDEPEAGLSLSNQKKLFKVYEKIVRDNNCQIILTTHSYVIISSVEKVFNMKTKKWEKSSDFLRRTLK